MGSSLGNGNWNPRSESGPVFDLGLVLGILNSLVPGVSAELAIRFVAIQLAMPIVGLKQDNLRKGHVFLGTLG